MKVEFLKKFSKDLDALDSKTIKSNLRSLIELVEESSSIEDIPNIKKLKGHKSAYRIRVGDYRLGFFFENGIIQMARFIHRKDIYKEFP
jgi:mRNA interferase RelE/StbE